jgi:hypothetical protein
VDQFKVVVALVLPEQEAKEGRQLFSTAFMPEVVPSEGQFGGARRPPLRLPHAAVVVPHGAVASVLKRAHEHAHLYPDALHAVFSEDTVPTTPSMCTVPSTAPQWAVKEELEPM